MASDTRERIITSAHDMFYCDGFHAVGLDRIIGDVGGSFRYDRDHLIDSVGKSAQRVVNTYDVSLEARKIGASAQMAVVLRAIPTQACR